MELDQVATIIRQLRDKLLYQPLTIFVSGSVADGLGHAQSDIDVFVLSAEPTLRERQISVDYVDDTRVDVEYWPIARVEAVTDQLENFACSGFEFEARPNLSYGAKDFVHRTLVGTAVTHAETFAEIQRGLNRYSLAWDNFYSYTQDFYGYQEDTAGLLTSEDFDTALLCGRMALERSIESLLAAKGETNPNRKWLFRKLSRNDEALVYQRYKAYLGIPTDRPMRGWVEEMLEYAVEVNVRAQKKIDKLGTSK